MALGPHFQSLAADAETPRHGVFLDEALMVPRIRNRIHVQRGTYDSSRSTETNRIPWIAVPVNDWK